VPLAAQRLPAACRAIGPGDFPQQEVAERLCWSQRFKLVHLAATGTSV
jgi:hypothetical protein